MPEKISCPQCRTAYKLPATVQSPLRITCKKCGQVFTASPTAITEHPEPILPVPPQRSEPQRSTGRSRSYAQPAATSAPWLLILLPLLVIAGVGGAVGMYFLFASTAASSNSAVARNSETAPTQNGDRDTSRTRPNTSRQNPRPTGRTNATPPTRPTNRDRNKGQNPDPKPTPTPETPVKAETKGGVVKFTAAPRQMVALPDGKTVVVNVPGANNLPGHLSVLELPSGQEKAQIPLPVAVNDQAILPDGKTLLQGSPAKPYLQLFDLQEQKVTRTLADQNKPVQAVAVSADGKLAATGGGKDDGVIRVWDLEAGKELADLGAPFRFGCNGLLFSPDGRQLFARGASKTRSNGEVRIWDVPGMKETAVLNSFAGDINALAVSPDGKLLAASYSGLNRGGLTIFHLPSGKEVLKIDNAATFGVAFGPAGDTVAAGFYNDSTIHVYELKTGKHAGGYRGHSGFYILQLAVAPGTKTLLSMGVDKTVRLWDLGTLDQVRQYGQARVTANPAVLTASGSEPPPGQSSARGQVVKLLPENRLVLSADGKEVTISRTEKTRFFGADGKPLPGGLAGRVYRIGNEVNVKLDGQNATEMRLVKEGPTELVLEAAQLVGVEDDTLRFTHDGKKIEAALGPKSVVKQMPRRTLTGQEAKAALQSGKDYWVKLGYDADVSLPVVREIRIELAYNPPPPSPDDFTLKNATLTLAKEGKDLVFSEGGKEVPFRVTKGMVGRRGKDVVPVEEILVPGNRLQVRLRKSGEQNTLVEANLAYEAQTFLFCNVQTHVTKGADGKVKTHFIRDANPLRELRWSAETRGRNLDGTPIDPAKLLTDKTRVTVYIRLLPEFIYVEEVRAGEGKERWDVEQFRNCTARVQRDKGKMNIQIHWGRKVMPVGLTTGIKGFDADGQPASARDLLVDGKEVDVIIAEDKGQYVLLEIRPAR